MNGEAESPVPLPREGPSAGMPAPPAFQQKLGLFDATMLVAGTMIGSGIFIVSADISRYVGSPGWLVAVWVLTGVITIMGALSYCELAAMMPHAGGQYVYLREAYSPLWGFLYGWTLFLVIQTGTVAAVAVAFAKFLGVLVPELGTDQILYRLDLRASHIEIAYTPPWMTEKLVFFKRDEFTISAGQLVGVCIVILLTALNCRGVREGKWVQNIFAVAKTLALILLIAVGFTVARNADAVAENARIFWEGMVTSGGNDTEKFTEVKKLVGQGTLAALMVAGAAMVGSLFSADAWNNVTFTAGEVKNPKRNLPWSMVLGAGLVILLYILANGAYLSALPMRGDGKLAAELKKEKEAAKTEAEIAAVEKKYAESTEPLGIDHAKDDRVATAALQLASPTLGVRLMAIAIMISTFGCVNGLILMGARLYHAMAKDGLFFQSVGRLNHRGVPGSGLMLQGVWSIVLLFSGTYGDLLDYTIFAALLFYVLTVIGLFVLRRKQPDAERPYRAFGYPLIPAVYVFLCAFIMLDLLVVKPQYSWPSFLIILSGIPVYFFWRARTLMTKRAG